MRWLMPFFLVQKCHQNHQPSWRGWKGHWELEKKPNQNSISTRSPLALRIRLPARFPVPWTPFERHGVSPERPDPNAGPNTSCNHRWAKLPWAAAASSRPTGTRVRRRRLNGNDAHLTEFVAVTSESQVWSWLCWAHALNYTVRILNLKSRLFDPLWKKKRAYFSQFDASTARFPDMLISLLQDCKRGAYGDPVGRPTLVGLCWLETHGFNGGVEQIENLEKEEKEQGEDGEKGVFGGFMTVC